MGMMKEFREFAMKGSLIDLAVGFVMGAAFSKVTTSFIQGMVMPLVGMIRGKDFSAWKWVLQSPVTDENGAVTKPEVAVYYGTFISDCIEFIVVALVMFLVVKAINRMKRKKEAQEVTAPPAPPKQEVLLAEIRDLLKK